MIDYWPLFLVFIIAWIVPLVLSWLEISKVPAVIVEIIMGVVIGPFVIDLMPEAPYLDFLASTGFLILIFLAGLEIDMDKILSSLPKKGSKFSEVSRNSFLLASLIYLISLLVSLPVAWLIGRAIDIDLIFFTLLLPTVALSIIVPILKADGILNTKFGQILLMEGAIATVMSIILISIYAGVLKNGFEVELLLFTVIFGVFIITNWLGKRLVKVRAFQKILYTLEHAASQIRVRGTIALLLLFVVVAHLIDTELVMGAFFAGVLLSLFVSRDRSALLFKLDGMSYGFFIPIFFIMVGVRLDLSALTEFGDSVPYILALIIGFFLIQIIPSLVLTHVFGIKRSLASGVLLAARMGLTIATAQIGLSLDVISTADNAAIVTAAIITSLLAPLGYKIFDQKTEEYHNIILFGGTQASLYLAERFKMHNLDCLTFLSKGSALRTEFAGRNLGCHMFGALDDEVIHDLELHAADQIIILTGSPQLDAQVLQYFLVYRKHKKIICSGLGEGESQHVDGVAFLDQEVIVADHIEDMVVRPDSVATLSQSFDTYRVEEVLVGNQSLHRALVKDVAFPPSGSLIIQRRKGEIFIPHGNTHILEGDLITVIGNGKALADFRRILE